MKTLSAWLYRISSLGLLLMAAGVFAIFMAVVLPDQAAKAAVYTGEVGSPDTSFFYTAETLFSLADQYGEAGRAAYIEARFTFDLIFPLVYGFFLATTISWFGKLSLAEDSRWRLLNLAPVLGVLFDYLENISAAAAMSYYPGRIPLVAWAAAIFTLIKWLFVYGSFLVLLVFALIWLVQRIRRQAS
jgi:hypothetical protein